MKLSRVRVRVFVCVSGSREGRAQHMAAVRLSESVPCLCARLGCVACFSSRAHVHMFPVITAAWCACADSLGGVCWLLLGAARCSGLPCAGARCCPSQPAVVERHCSLHECPRAGAAPSRPARPLCFFVRASVLLVHLRCGCVEFAAPPQCHRSQSARQGCCVSCSACCAPCRACGPVVAWCVPHPHPCWWLSCSIEGIHCVSREQAWRRRRRKADVVGCVVGWAAAQRGGHYTAQRSTCLRGQWMAVCGVMRAARCALQLGRRCPWLWWCFVCGGGADASRGVWCVCLSVTCVGARAPRPCVVQQTEFPSSSAGWLSLARAHALVCVCLCTSHTHTWPRRVSLAVCSLLPPPSPQCCACGGGGGVCVGRCVCEAAASVEYLHDVCRGLACGRRMRARACPATGRAAAVLLEQAPSVLSVRCV
jgi:hypothetical protein